MAALERIRAGRLLAMVLLALVVGSSVAPGPAVVAASTRNVAAPASEVVALSAWTGGVNLYRSGTFTTQQSWLWCTAAGVQIARNIVERKTDHSTSKQRAYFDWMRERNRYDLPESAGVDPQGWTAGLRHFVDDRYRLVSSRTFDGALRSAVERLRLTNLPVAITVSHGGHGWILTGFTATADPAATASFKVTSVRVVGPLYGRQSKNGYDMPPNTKLTPTQLKRFFTPWKYDPKPMIWDGRYVSIQPVPTKPASAPAPAPEPAATATPAPVTVAPTAPPSITATPQPSAVATASPGPLAEAGATSASPASAGPGAVPVEPTSSAGIPTLAIVLGGVVVLVALGAIAVGARPSRRVR